MMDGDDDTTIGTGGWALVVLSGVVTFAVLWGWLFYHPLPAALFSAAIALMVMLLLYRLAVAVNRYDDAEEAKRVRRVVPAAEVGVRTPGDALGAIPAAMAVPARPETAVAPQRPAPVVTPLTAVEPAPVIVPPTLAAPAAGASEAVAEADEPAAEVVAAEPPRTRAKAAAKPKAETKPKTAKAKAEPKPKAEKTAKPKASKAKPAALVRLDAPRAGGADDLQEIEGIGPALEKLLNSLGFYHFDQLAGWTEADVALIDAEMKTFKGRITRDKWVDQARIIVNEGLEAFRERAKTNSY